MNQRLRQETLEFFIIAYKSHIDIVIFTEYGKRTENRILVEGL